MSASITTVPPAALDLLSLLADIDGAAHQAVRTERFAASEAGGTFDLIRCRCGGLYGATAFERHVGVTA